MIKTFKKGEWIIVQSKDILMFNGNGITWAEKYEHKVGQIVSEFLPNVYRTTIDDKVLFEWCDLKNFKGGI